MVRSKNSSTFFFFLWVFIALASVAGIHLMVSPPLQQVYLTGYDPLAVTFLSGELISFDSWSLVHLVTFFGYAVAHHL